MCVGKWHLGRPDAYLPTSRGFDEYYRIPYSNDMTPRVLMHNTEVIEEPAILESLTARYTEQATKFIAAAKGAPFFLYMPHTFPHIPLAASARFRGKSSEGLYGDVVEEIDWSVGEVLRTLRQNGLDTNTLVMFSSDNGQLGSAMCAHDELEIARRAPQYRRLHPRSCRWPPQLSSAKPELYNLATDPDESYDVAAENPQIVEKIHAKIADMLKTFPEPVQKAWAEQMERKANPATPAGAALHRKRGRLSSLADKTKAKEDVLDELGSGVRAGEL